MASTIIRKNGYYINKNLNNDILNIIKNDLTVEPYISFTINNKKDTNNKIIVYKETEDNIIVPKFYGINKFGIPVINEEQDGRLIDINFLGNLRDNQKIIVADTIKYLTEHKGGILCLPCASGKTVIGIFLSCYFKVKTLIIVHKTFLLSQWKERLEEFSNAKIGILQQNTIDIENKDIVIGMLQSISKNKYDIDIFKDFGFVIFDEAHHAPSKHFSTALPIISCKYNLGLSATPWRKDKLEKILFWYFGDIICKNSTIYNQLVTINIIEYSIEHEKFKEFKLYNGKINCAKTINKLITIGRRNKLIVEKITDEILKNNKRKIIVLSDRIKHLELLKNRLNNIHEYITTSFYIGKMKIKELKLSEQSQVIFASYGMASEGLDIPDLNTLFMVTPRKDIEQSIGRILRKIDIENPPIIYDFVDMMPFYINQGYHRKKLYKKLNFDINTYTITNGVNDTPQEISIDTPQEIPSNLFINI